MGDSIARVLQTQRSVLWQTEVLKEFPPQPYIRLGLRYISLALAIAMLAAHLTGLQPTTGQQTLNSPCPLEGPGETPPPPVLVNPRVVSQAIQS